RFASPVDIGPAARKHPHARFIVYHSGFETGTMEGPYTRATKTVGVNRLITSLLEAGIGPNENVYAELGSTFWYLMRTPTQAAHASRGSGPPGSPPGVARVAPGATG